MPTLLSLFKRWVVDQRCLKSRALEFRAACCLRFLYHNTIIVDSPLHASLGFQAQEKVILFYLQASLFLIYGSHLPSRRTEVHSCVIRVGRQATIRRLKLKLRRLWRGIITKKQIIPEPLFKKRRVSCTLALAALRPVPVCQSLPKPLLHCLHFLLSCPCRNDDYNNVSALRRQVMGPSIDLQTIGTR